MAESFGKTEVTFTHDILLGDNKELMTDACTVLSGEGVVARGTLVGKITVGTVSQAFAGTGNGTSTLPVKGPLAQLGDYKARLITAAVNLGDFELIAPDGQLVGIVKVGVAFTGSHLTGFTISDGSTDFIVGDLFTFTVAAGSGKYEIYNAANVNGSGNPVNIAILATAVDSTSADVVSNCYTAGAFNETALVGYVAALKSGLESRGIHIRKNLPNA